MDLDNKKSEKPWQELGSESKAEYLLKTGHLSDCSFLVGDGDNVLQFKCHKWVLISASSVFERMFCGEFLEAQSLEPIRIIEMDPHDFRRFLLFIYDPHSESYSEFSSLSLETIKNLVYLGKKYLVNRLIDRCFDGLKKKIDSENVTEELAVRVFEFSVTIENETLQARCIETLASFEGLQLTDSVCDLDPPIFKQLLEELDTVPTEILLHSIATYIDVNNLYVNEGIFKPTKQKNFQAIKSLYEAVHFNDISAKEFCEFVDKPIIQKHLVDAQKYKILKRLVLSENKDLGVDF